MWIKRPQGGPLAVLRRVIAPLLEVLTPVLWLFIRVTPFLVVGAHLVFICSNVFFFHFFPTLIFAKKLLALVSAGMCFLQFAFHTP